MRMRQCGLLKCHNPATEAFSAECLRLLPASAACFLELNDVYWRDVSFWSIAFKTTAPQNVSDNT